MSRRDLGWRLGGLALFIAACGLSMTVKGSPAIVVLFLLALLSLPLMIHGRHVGQAFRAERRGRCHTAEVVHAARVRRRGRNTDGHGRPPRSEQR